MDTQALNHVLERLAAAARDAGRPQPRLLAVSKTQPATAVAEMADALRAASASGAFPDSAAFAPAFGENYVQEALAKQAALAGQTLEWHLIGHLQSNKAREAALAFDWVQTVDRDKLVAALARHRAPDLRPLNVLVQVNIDDEASKHGCVPEQVPAIAAAIEAQPRLLLRGLMAIPAPHPDATRRRAAFGRMKALFDALAARHPQVDTLSMGMSDDLELAVAEGATMVRVGTALFGRRAPGPGDTGS
ncbi:YggS family pyridoxal phosphate-dependent enzyme [Luteimonas notoginsengisoli]|uniref:Pyridoxal phosphate homeostasis protein n=1 Tax=Luteimonas notoginsengisoli TaxID=1578200 RepID=A0ABV7UPZ7_9GAMM